jgi:hypothetical protein
MNIKRAVLCGALLWILIFFEVCILMFGFKLTAGTTYYIIHYILAAILAIIVALIYFRGKVKKGALEGLIVGLVMLVTSIILDAVITVPLFVKSYGFFIDPYLWLGMLGCIVIVVIVASISARRG